MALSLCSTWGACTVRKSATAQWRLRVVMRAEGSSLRGGQRGLPLPITQPSGNMWTSVYSLRKSTPEEANCKPTEESCTIARIVQTYDSTCACCKGAGTLKTRRFSSSRFRKVKGVSCRCMMCGGVGYVRMCTTRVEPDFSKDDSLPAEYRPGEKKGEGSQRLTIK